ncbi:alpha/beta fold hydrolase [Desulfospira joergensenii]|uniref:alpha/beta fold hydrolase n=1 Tax=Desulfospira joergensenii TaxID=53329 RepID=UPI0013767CC7|nr:alpha/beta hydrolase [Desulfospira joergensenii]
MNLKSIIVNGYEMTYLDQGEGIPVIWIHGSLGDCRSWENQTEFFSKKYRTLVLNLRPGSSEFGNESPVSIGHHAEDLSGFIKTLDMGPVHLVGHSRGGAVVLKMMTVHPDLFHSAVLADPAPFAQLFSDDSEGMEEIERRNRIVGKALDLIQKGDLDKGLELFTDSVSRMGAWKKFSEAARQIRRENAGSLKSLIRDVQEPLNCENLKKIKNPVLLITGENSPRIYGRMHETLRGCLRNFQWAVIGNASHGMHRDNPETFNGFVIDFLNKNSPKQGR